MCHPPSPKGHPLHLAGLLPESTPLWGGRTLGRGLHGSQEQAQVHLNRESWGLGHPESNLELWTLGSRVHLPSPMDPCLWGEKSMEEG